MRYLRNINVQWGRIDTTSLAEMELADDERERYRVRKGDLLVCEGGEVGRAAIWRRDDEYIAYQKALHRVRPKDGLAPEYLRYALENAARTGALKPFTTGSTIAHLPQQNLRRLPITLAPEGEQLMMIEALEGHLSRLDAGARSLRAARGRIERLLSTLLWRETHQLPDARVARLDAIAEVRLGRQRSPKNHSGNRMRPYLRAANVDWNRLRLDDVKEMHFSEAEEEAYRLEKGDILLTEASGSPAEVGKSVLYQGIPGEVCFQNTLLRVRPHDADPAFLQKYLLAEARAGRFMPKSRGVGINHLGRARLAALEIELPALAEQIAAARRVEEAIGLIERLRDSVQQQERRAEQLRRGLLAAVFSGRLTGDAGIAGTKQEALAG